MSSVRLVLTEDTWTEIATVLQDVKRKDGRPAEQSDRMFLEAVLYVARTGIPWRDMPQEFGQWDAVYNRFRRWERRGIWRKLWEGLQHDACTSAKQLFIDSTIVRAHQHAAGALKKTRMVNSASVCSGMCHTLCITTHGGTRDGTDNPSSPSDGNADADAAHALLPHLWQHDVGGLSQLSHDHHH